MLVKKILLISMLSLVVVNALSLVVHANEQQEEDFMQIVKAFMPTNSSLINPNMPVSTKSIQFYDFNNDGQEEIIFTFEIKAKDQPAPSHFGAIVLKKDQTGWQKVWETITEGVSLDFSGLIDITGDGIKEYLFSVTIGAAIGSELEVFQWGNHSLKKIAEIPYNKMDVVNEKQKVAIAIWQLYIGDSYLVDVLKWNGEKLVYDEASYSKYYPNIEKFYHDKISQMDAWYYWYCLADAQMKAKKLDEANRSIQKGIELAKKSAVHEAVQYFDDLIKKLRNKKK
ncbi:hypothetical protein ACIQXW_07660 [Lysinibacillus sp. NPDC097162]|uniref:hypothetical protein n=1 Tax=Lysinibacillus sp. NPDC097162 TaxID=3364140 RepID=UPI0037F9A6D8